MNECHKNSQLIPGFQVTRHGFHRGQTAVLPSLPGDVQTVQGNHRPQCCAVILPAGSGKTADSKETFQSLKVVNTINHELLWQNQQEKMGMGVDSLTRPDSSSLYCY